MTTAEQIKALLAQASALVDTIQTTPTQTTMYAEIEGLNIRSGPGTSYAIKQALHLGDAVTVTSITGQWATITAPIAGFVYVSSLGMSKPLPKL